MNRHVANGVKAVGKGEQFFAEAAEEWLAAHDEDGLSWREIDREIGRGHDYARRFVDSWCRGRATPFAEIGGKRSITTTVKQADRVKMAEKLLEDPKVVKSVLAKPNVVSRGVTNAVLEKQEKERAKKAEQNQRAAENRTAAAPPISAALSAMITKIDQL